MKIGIFSTFIEQAALDLVKTIEDAVEKGEIPNTEVSFIFSSREEGENKITDHLLNQLECGRIPLVTFSASNFEPKMRQETLKRAKEGNDLLLSHWRNLFGDEITKRLPQTDLDVLVGDMYIWGDNLTRRRNGINLHPALPHGPKGEWYKVVWELIENRASETGVMMHKVTKDLDRGPTVTFCRFPIKGPQFDSLWRQLPQEPYELSQLIKSEAVQKEKTIHPLHREVRRHGLVREFPLVVQTIKASAEGKIHFEGDFPVDETGRTIKGGYDLTDKIDEIVKPILEV